MTSQESIKEQLENKYINFIENMGILKKFVMSRKHTTVDNCRWSYKISGFRVGILNIKMYATGSLKNITSNIAIKPVKWIVDTGAKISLFNLNFINELKYQPKLFNIFVPITSYSIFPIRFRHRVHLNIEENNIQIDKFPYHTVTEGGNIMGNDRIVALVLYVNSA